jgi:hypothetical protein
MLAGRLAKPGHDPRIDLAGQEPVGLYPNPSKVWKHTGVQPCPYCLRTARLLEFNLQGQQTSACLTCLLGNGVSFAFGVGVGRVFAALEDGWHPQNPQVAAALSTLDTEGALVGLHLALEARYFLSPKEVRFSSREAYVRVQGVVGRAMLDPSLPPEFSPPLWVVSILSKMLE